MSRIDGPQAIGSAEIKYIPAKINTLNNFETTFNTSLNSYIPQNAEQNIYSNPDKLADELEKLSANKNNTKEYDKEKGFWDKFRDTVMPKPGEYIDNNPPKEDI